MMTELRDVQDALLRHADIWEREGSDPCRVRVTRSLAETIGAWADGTHSPDGPANAWRRSALDAQRAVEALRKRVKRGVGVDLTPTTLGTEDVIFWYEYIASLDTAWRNNITHILNEVTENSLGDDLATIAAAWEELESPDPERVKKAHRVITKTLQAYCSGHDIHDPSCIWCRMAEGERSRAAEDTPSEKCCQYGCDGGACESCPCCCAGWCVSGHDGIPEDSEDREIWLSIVDEVNPQLAESVRKLLAVPSVEMMAKTLHEAWVSMPTGIKGLQGHDAWVYLADSALGLVRVTR